MPSGRAAISTTSRRKGWLAGCSAAPEPAPPPPPAPGTEPAGFIDYFGALPGLGGWLFGGWVRGEILAELPECGAEALFEGGGLAGRAFCARHPRPDVAGLGHGFVAFLPGEPEAGHGGLKTLRFEAGGAQQLQLSLGARQPGEI